MDSVRILVLGPIEARVDGKPVDLGGPRQRSVLERLLVARGQVVPVDRVVDDLWRGEPPRQATGALQAYVSHLRRVLEPGRPPRAPAQVLVSSPPGYAVRLRTEAVDAWAFDRAVTDGRALLPADPAAALARFREALAMWGGPAYAEVAEESWAVAEAGRLGELNALAHEGEAQAMIDLGDAAGAVADLEAATTEYPMREEGWRLLALALYGAGRQADALATLRRARRLLREALGLDPGPALADLERAILTQHTHLPEPARGRLVVLAPRAQDAPGDAGIVLAPRAGTAALADPAGAGGSDPGDTGGTAAGVVPGGWSETFVGRSVELAALEAAASRAGAGRATVALVGGEPGSGKSALVEHAGARLAAEGWHVLFGRCPEADGAPPAWAWTQLLSSLDQVVRPAQRRHRPVVVQEEGPSRSAISLSLREWPATPVPVNGHGTGNGHGHGNGHGNGHGHGHDAVERFHLHQRVVAMLGAHIEDTPRGLVLVFDDLHRADDETLAMLRSVVGGLGRCRLLVLAAYRTTEADARLEDTFAALAHQSATRLRLSGLGTGDAAMLVTEVAGMPVEPGVLGHLVDRTGGNPFFLRESARLLASEGTTAALAAVPDGVRDVLRRRVARLPEEAVSVLRLAALAGRDVDVDVLAEAADVGEEAVLAALEVGMLAGLLTEPSTGVVRFTHVMVREVLEGDLSRIRRARWHTHLAAAYERLRPGDLAALAYHHGRAATAATLDRALDYTARAARAAEARFAHDTAAVLWRQAGELLELAPPGSDRGGPGERVELAGHLLRAQVLAGAVAHARATRDVAVHTAVTAGDDDLLARALTLWEVPTTWAPRDYARRDDDTVAWVERLLAATPGTPTSGTLTSSTAISGISGISGTASSGTATSGAPPDAVAAERRCRLLCVLATELEGEDGEDAQAASAEAVELARRIGDPELLCQALNARALATNTHDATAERRRIAAELGALGERHGLVHYQVVSHHLAIQADAADVDIPGVRRHLGEATAIARRYQLVECLDVATMTTGMVLHIEGRFGESEATYLQVAADMRRHGSFNPDGVELIGLATLRMSQGRMAEMVESTRYAVSEFGAVAVDAHVLALLAAGDPRQARAVWRERAACRRDYFWLIFMAMRAYAAIGLAETEPGALEEAEAAYAELAPWESQLAGASCGGVTLGPVAHVLGDVARALGRSRDAADHYRTAEKVATSAGSRPWLEAARRRLG